jgi:hypothetical protein
MLLLGTPTPLAARAAAPAAPPPPCPTIPSVDDRCELWASVFDDPGGYPKGGKDIQFDADLSPDGSRIFVVGRSDHAGASSPDGRTVAYDAATGERLWQTRYDGPLGAADSANEVIVSPDSRRVFVAGWRDSGGPADFVTIAYDAATGVEIWASAWNGPGKGSDSGLLMAVSPDGSTVYTVGTTPRDGQTDTATVAYDAIAGTPLWAAIYAGKAAGTDTPIGVSVSPDGSGIFLAVASQGNNTDYAVVRYDPDGRQRWETRYDGPVNGRDSPGGLVAGPDGLYVTGETTLAATTTSLARTDYATLALDPDDGKVLWTARYTGPSDGTNGATALALSPDGRTLVVTGKSTGTSYYDDSYGTVAYSAATGAQLWAKTFGLPSFIFGGYDQGRAVEIDPAGRRAYVSGFSGDGVYKNDYATVAYDLVSGDVAWTARYSDDGVARQSPQSVLVSPKSDRVYVVGSIRRLVAGFSCTDCNEYDFGTVAYSAT